MSFEIGRHGSEEEASESDFLDLQPPGVEYRCIFLPTDTEHGDEVTEDRIPGVAFYFNLAIAEHVTAANYTKATGKGGKYSVTVGESTTDNFGSILDKDTSYVVAILSIVPPDVEDSAKYQSTIKFTDQHFTPKNQA